MLPIVEYFDDLDFEIGGNANNIGPSESYNDNLEELLNTIDIEPYVHVLNIAPLDFRPLNIVSMAHLSSYAGRASSGRQKDKRICIQASRYCPSLHPASHPAQADGLLHDIDSLHTVGVSVFGQEPEQDGERHVVILYAQNTFVFTSPNYQLVRASSG